ncbi:MAG: YdcF family protein [Gemmatimonadales bacterium]
MLRPRRPFFLRRRVILGSIGVIAALWVASVATVLTWALQDDARKADAIVVMGAAQYQGKPSPVLRARLDHALALWQRGLAPTLVLTGGIGEGDTASEAAVSRVYMMGRGVPDTAILLEHAGRTSAQSLRAAVTLLRTRGLATAIFVSDPFHMLRLEILGRRYGINPYTSPALPTPGAQRLLRQWGTLLAESVKAPLALFVDW